MDPVRLQELFDRYLQRRCTPEEVVELIALLEQGDAAEVLTEPMLRLWAELKGVEYPVDWDRMYARISQVEDDLSVLNRPRRIGWTVAAAACVVLVVGGLLFWRMDRRQVVVVKAPVARTVEKRVIHLPDGSTVLLNKNSRLDYPKVFGDTLREVTLTGEAYFDIVASPGKPFIVKTGKLSTRVLGTSFNIRAYPGDKAIAITVTSGKVQVLDDRVAVGTLTADQQLRYDVSSESIVKQQVDVRPLVAWRPSEVSFDDITMEEAAHRVEDWFGIKVSFVNPTLRNCRVTASFYREDQLEEIMTVLCAVNQMSYTIHDGVVVIDGKGCN